MSDATPPPTGRADELKRALLAIRDLRRRVTELEGSASEPVAIVGLSCRFPGGANTPDKFWALLRDGVDATTEVPKTRWDAEAIYNPDPDAAQGCYVKRGGFLREPVDEFDPTFFGISPREASAIDPVHRMLLELAWEAFEHAGIPPLSLENSLTGVFTGLSLSDYDVMQRGGLQTIHSYRGTGTIQSVAGGRISHILGLQGPNFPVDTACSSGLTALVLAVQQLRNRRCDLALAGSAHLMLSPEATVALCRMRALSADGRCHTFDASAGGYARGEGGGMFVLKRLADAQAAGDQIHAVIRGVACNHDGRSSGLTVPNPAAQSAVIAEALRDAGLQPGDIDYVEAHGTATPLGDPIELRALSSVLCRDRGPEHRLMLGSVKANLGHLEPAAGVTGVCKVVQALRHRQIPPHLHFTQPTPHFEWSNHPIVVPTTLTDWAPRDHPRRAGVSAFGFSGTNAHVILEEAPAPAESAPKPARPIHVITLSGRSRAGVRELAGRYREQLASGAGTIAADLAATATAGRSHLPCRAVVSGATAAELDAALAMLIERGDEAIAQARSAGPGPVAFLFTGQGAQYPGMARELAETSPVFRAALERCAEILRPHLDRPLLPLVTDPAAGDLLHQTAYTQPALFAVEYALAELWRSWGLTPSYVVGHSLGEYVAATVAGVMTLEDALPLVARRGRMMQELPAGGRMVAIFAPEPPVADALQGLAGVAIAAVNGPANTVVSGAGDAVAEVLRRLEPARLRVSELKVSHAFHSPLMDPILARFEDAVRQVTLRAPTIGLVSNLSGRLLTAAEATDPARWRRHIREAVRFGPSMAKLAELNVRCFVEIGPHPTLAGLAAETVTARDARWLPSLRRGQPAWPQLAHSLGELYRAGGEIDWAGWNRDHAGRRIPGPTYPFQRERYWFTDLEPGGAADPAVPAGGVSGVTIQHPLLGSLLQSPALAGWAFQVALRAHHPAWLAEHRVQDRVVLPGAAFTEMMLAAAREGPGWTRARITELTFERPLVLPERDALTCQVVVGPVVDGRCAVQIVTAPALDKATRWTTHATGTLRAADAGAPPATPALAAARAACPRARDVAGLYRHLASRGIQYGRAFQPLQECWTGEGEAVGRARLDSRLTVTEAVDCIHPTLLDAGFQVLDALGNPDEDATFLPAGIDEIHFLAPAGRACWIHGRSRPQPDPHLGLADITFFDDAGQPVLALVGFRARRVKGALVPMAPAPVTPAELIYALDWSPVEAPAAADLAGAWLILADDGGVGNEVAQRLRAAGGRGVLVRRGAAWQHDGDTITVPRAGDGAWTKVFEAAGFTREPATLRGIVHAWSLDPQATEDAESGALTDRAIDSTLPLASLLAARPQSAPVAVRLLTRGVAGPEAAAPVRWDDGAALWGLLPVLQAEHAEVNCRILDLDPDPARLAADHVMRWLFGAATEDRIVLRHDHAFAPRLNHAPAGAPSDDARAIPAGAAYRIDIKQRGTLDAVQYLAVERVAPRTDEVEVRIHATGLNFRDVLNVLGMYPGDPGPPGVEYAGVVARVGAAVTTVKPGDAVMGIGTGAFASHVVVPAAAVMPIPARLSFEEAATIPLAFLTSEWGLMHLAQLRRGERVLIHAAAGGVGQAAVQLALAVGAEVFATAGSNDKRAYLRAQGVRHIFDSRHASFADEVLAATNGEGVDVVLNSLTGDMLQRSVDLLKPGGRFLELGKAELLDPAAVAARRPGAKYFVYDLGTVLFATPDQFQAMFRSMADRFAAGVLRPLRIQNYPATEVVPAFRFMAQAKHIGKVVIAGGAQRPAETTPPIRRDGAYVVTGAGGGIGRTLVEWLVRQDAGAVILNGRTEPTADTVGWLDQMRAAGARLSWVAADIAEYDDAARLLDTTASGLPLRGIFHCAGVLDDGLLFDQTRERFARVLRPKIAGAWNLHRVARTMELDHFVLFSSIAASMGGPGQASYAAGNAFLGALAERRRRAGLPALAVEWGAWAGSGMAARLSDREKRLLEERGSAFLDPAVALTTLAGLLATAAPRRTVAAIDWERVRRNTRVVPPLLRTILAERKGTGSDKAADATVAFHPDELHGLDADARRARLVLYVRSVLGKALGLRLARLAADAEIGHLGFDSLMAMELRNRIETDTGIVVPVSRLLSSGTPAELAETLDGLLAATTVPTPANARASTTEGEI